MKANNKKLTEELMYQYDVTCCGRHFRWPGRAPESIRWTCGQCGGRMKAREEQVRTAEAATLIARHLGRFNEECVCGARHGHHVVLKERAYFLRCGTCGEELRELEPKEVEQ